MLLMYRTLVISNINKLEICKFLVVLDSFSRDNNDKNEKLTLFKQVYFKK